MTIENAKKAAELLKEIETLSIYEKMIGNEGILYQKPVFILSQKYVEGINNAREIVIDSKYTHLFIPVLKGLIDGLKKQLEAL